MAKRLSRIERDIERLKEKISEYQQQLKELEAAKTEQENLQIIQLVRSIAFFSVDLIGCIFVTAISVPALL